MSSNSWGRRKAWVMIAEGEWESKTGESNLAEERVMEVIEWEARARSATINSIDGKNKKKKKKQGEGGTKTVVEEEKDI